MSQWQIHLEPSDREPGRLGFWRVLFALVVYGCLFLLLLRAIKFVGSLLLR